MGYCLSTPNHFEVPETVNGWTHDPEPYNGTAWFSPDRDQSVVAFNTMSTVYAAVYDERCEGMKSRERIFERKYDRSEDLSVAELQERERAANAELIEDVVAWMREHPPGQWSHPRVNEAVFDAPPGYELVTYAIEGRDSTITYRRTDADDPGRRLLSKGPDEKTLDTCPYLVIHTWVGSGNSTIALAPWTHAHDHEMTEIVETPDKCGLDVALTMARQWAREHVDEEPSGSVAVGQTNLGQFAGAGRS